MPDTSLPQPMPGQGPCPPGFRPSAPYPGMPTGAGHSCSPIGPGVPAGGWTEARPGSGPGYPPTAARGLDAINALVGSAAGIEEDQAKVSSYLGDYGDWIRSMAGRR